MQITYNPKWPYIPDHSYRILIIGGSGSGQTNALLNSLNRKPDINKIQLYAKDQNKAKYNFFNQKTWKRSLKALKWSRSFFYNSKDMQDVSKNIDDYNPGEKRKVSIMFNDKIAV